jgi:hypothetical protein
LAQAVALAAAEGEGGDDEVHTAAFAAAEGDGKVIMRPMQLLLQQLKRKGSS